MPLGWSEVPQRSRSVCMRTIAPLKHHSERRRNVEIVNDQRPDQAAVGYPDIAQAFCQIVYSQNHLIGWFGMPS